MAIMADNSSGSSNAVAHNCHGKTKTSRQKQKHHGKTKNLTAKTKTSRQNQRPHGKTKCLRSKTQYPEIPHGKSKYSRQNQSYFAFAVKYLVLPWGILFLPWGFWFCREVFCFCRDVLVLPWQLWATIPYILPTVFFLLLFTTLSYKTPIMYFEWRWQSDFGVSILVRTIWLWGIHSSHNYLTLGYPF